jgi:SP family sugar:H+ symporter-like MFS transporter
LIFFGCLIFAFFYVFFMVPETKGITLEEVDELYRTGVKPWKSSKWTPSTKQHKAMDALEEGRRNSEGTLVGGAAGEKKSGGRAEHEEQARTERESRFPNESEEKLIVSAAHVV